jgi:hypothetical protein
LPVENTKHNRMILVTFFTAFSPVKTMSSIKENGKKRGAGSKRTSSPQSRHVSKKPIQLSNLPRNNNSVTHTVRRRSIESESETDDNENDENEEVEG